MPPPDVAAAICACVTRLAGTLKPEYAEALAQIDVQGIAVKDYAAQHGLTAVSYTHLTLPTNREV